MQMPRDPMLLMSMANTYLRDEYSSLDALCEDRLWDKEALCSRLREIGFEYIPEINQFR